MTKEIKIHLTELKNQIDAAAKVTAVFDVKHIVDDVWIATGEEIRSTTDEDTMKNRIERRARKLYNEYEEQKVWFGYNLPHNWNINSE